MAESTTTPPPTSVGGGARPTALGGLLRPLRRRDFALLVTGQTVSTFGDFLFIIAFPFLLLAGPDGLRELSISLTALGIARLAGTPLGGLLADRWHPRVAMIGADVARMGALLWLAATLAGGSPPLWQFATVASVIGLLDGVFLPAYRAVTPAVLPPAELAAGNSTGESLNIVAAIAAQLVAGLAVAHYGAPAVLRVDAATFAFSGVTLLAMTARSVTARSVTARSVTTPLDRPVADTPPAGTTFRSFAARSNVFQVITLMTAMVSITAAGLFAVGLPVLAHQRFTSAAEAYGVLLVAMAAGRLVGTVLAGSFVTARRRGLLTLALLVVHGAVLVGLSRAGGLATLLPMLVVLGFADGTLLVVVTTVMQQIAPREILGRVMATMAFTQVGSFPISVALAGWAVGRWGLAPTFVAGGTGVLLVAVFGLSRRAIRDA